jgi:hypothetical protein
MTAVNRMASNPVNQNSPRTLMVGAYQAARNLLTVA